MTSNRFAASAWVRAILALSIALASSWAIAQGGSLQGFRTPSNNIHCMLEDFGAAHPPMLRCDMGRVESRIPRAPAGCDGDWGTAFGITPDNEPARRLCVTDTVYSPDWPVLRYGRTLRLGDFTCQSERTGLSCLNSSGHGFRLSRAAQRLF